MSKASTTSSALRLSYSNLHKLKTSQPPKSKLIVSKMQINHASLNSRQKFCFFSLSFLMVIFPFCIHSAKFKKLINCVIKTVEICVGNVLLESWIENLVHGNFKENTTCLKGGREIPSLLSLDYLCNSSFIPAANNCSRNFHQKFDADKSDPELCS